MKKIFMLMMAVAAVVFGCNKNDGLNSKDKKIDSIIFTESDIELIIGEVKYLNVTHYPENVERPNYVWSSSNDEIVTVDDEGTVTALKKGEAKITVSTPKWNLKDEILIKVIPPAPEKLELTAPEKELFIGKTLELAYRILPDQAEIIEPSDLEWETSDSKIATVSNGVVKGIDEGRASISAKVKGTGIVGRFTVDVKHIKITELHFEPVGGAELESGYSYDIKNITYLPSDATDTIFAYSYRGSWDNTDIISSNNFHVKSHLTEGTVQVKVSTRSGVSKTNYYKVIPTKPKSMRVIPAQDTIEVLKGYTFDMNVQLQPSFVMDDIIKYSSDSPEIVRLEKEYHVLTNRGLALKEGKATITMTPRTSYGSDVSERRVILVKELEDFISGSITKKQLSTENGVYFGKLTFNFSNNYLRDILIKGATMVYTKERHGEAEIHKGISVLGHRIRPNQNFSFEIEIKKEQDIGEPKKIYFQIQISSQHSPHTYTIDY